VSSAAGFRARNVLTVDAAMPERSGGTIVRTDDVIVTSVMANLRPATASAQAAAPTPGVRMAFTTRIPPAREDAAEDGRQPRPSPRHPRGARGGDHGPGHARKTRAISYPEKPATTSRYSAVTKKIAKMPKLTAIAIAFAP
jgi:hypothetical protein